jgi:hypothetical protein
MAKQTRFLFSQVADAFQKVYGKDARSRLDRMCDLGLFAQVGRGGLVSYGRTDIRKIVVCMELAAAGAAIAEIVRQFASDWKTYNGFCKDAEREDRTADVFLYIVREADDVPGSVPKVVTMTAREFGKLFDAYLRGGVGAPRLVGTNLSMHLRRMRETLKVTPARMRGRPRKNATIGKPASAGGREPALDDRL